MASDVYGQLVHTSLGRKVVTGLGLPNPATLRRYEPGDPLLPGAAVVGGLGPAPLADRVGGLLRRLGIEVLDEAPDEGRIAAVVADLTEVEEPADLETLRALVGPALRRLGPSGRVVVLGRPPETASSWAQAAARRALEGVTRSVGKELRDGATANVVLVAGGLVAGGLVTGGTSAERTIGGDPTVGDLVTDDGGDGDDDGGADGDGDPVEATLRFLLSGRSAFVDGQVVRVGARSVSRPADWSAPLAGRVAVVTGAARGIGAAVTRVLARDGATVVAVDVPGAGDALARMANEVRGSALQVDVTSPDAGARIVEHARTRHGGLDVVVHNAGITRDKLLANMDPDRWGSVVDVNLGAILRMNEAILDEGGLRPGGHVVLVASIAGIAGNRGQTNYAASKAGVIGLVGAMAADEGLRARGITVNAVAPGFIETEMTARMPLATREAGRRLSSLAQGGLPRDVAETVAWLSQDANAAVTGAVVRVCGQSLLGA